MLLQLSMLLQVNIQVIEEKIVKTSCSLKISKMAFYLGEELLIKWFEDLSHAWNYLCMAFCLGELLIK